MGTADLINLWPTIDSFAEDCGVRVGHARVWRHRGSIPARYWSVVARRAEARAIAGASLSDLARLAEGGAGQAVEHEQASAA